MDFFKLGFIGKYINELAGGNGTVQLAVLLIASLFIIAVAYVLGSLNFAIIISGKTYKEDIRNYGSKNAGMTNMMRTYGKKAAVLTLLGDAAKAAVAALVGYTVLGHMGAYIAGFSCVLGHMFPVFYKFKGFFFKFRIIKSFDIIVHHIWCAHSKLCGIFFYSG